MTKFFIPLFIVALAVPGFSFARSSDFGATTQTNTSSEDIGGVKTQLPPKEVTTGKAIKLVNPLGEDVKLGDLLKRILAFVVKIGAIVVIFMLVWVGFLFVTAGGDTTKLTTAKRGLLWTIVGALILLGAQAIAEGIKATVEAISVGK